MAERIEDAQDRWLRAAFDAAPIADDGFSQRVVAKLKRRLWLRRLTLPIAASIGAALALPPLLDLLNAFQPLIAMLPADASADMLSASLDMLMQPSAPSLSVGAGALLGAGMVVFMMAESA